MACSDLRRSNHIISYHSLYPQRRDATILSANLQMPQLLYFFPDHEPFFGPAPEPTPAPTLSFNSMDIAKMLRKLIVAFSSPKSRRIDNRSIQAFYAMNAKVSEHPFWWCWYIDKHLTLLQSAGVLSDQLLMPLEVTAYRSWTYDDDIPILLTRIRMYHKSLKYLASAPMHDLWVVEYNRRRFRSRQVVFKRPKRIDGEAKAIGHDLQPVDMEDLQETECAICVYGFDGGHGLRNHDPVMTICKHVYGHDCIVKWLSKHETCPMCRLKLV